MKVKKIVYSVPMGAAGTDLWEAQPKQLTIDSKNWDVSFVRNPPTGTSSIELTPASSTSVAMASQASVTVTVQFEVNKAQGAADIKVTETTDTSGESHLSVPKNAAGFEFGYLEADPIAVEHGSYTDLKWQGKNIESYTLSYDNKVAPISGDAVRYRVDDLTKPTAFALQAKPKNTSSGYLPTLTTSIDVRNPDLTIGNLTCSGTLTVDRIRSFSKPEKVDCSFLFSREGVDLYRDTVAAGHRFITFTSDGLVWIFSYTLKVPASISPNNAYFATLSDGSFPAVPLVENKLSIPLPVSAGSRLTVAPSGAVLEEVNNLVGMNFLVISQGYGVASRVTIDEVEADAANRRISRAYARMRGND
ncbi:hypothetical protein [Streptomyces murinus]|uniref:hypothetical protein n=1 Tax=Streptomyces murinus TaxID=33900 RepID=UPI003F47C094